MVDTTMISRMVRQTRMMIFFCKVRQTRKSIRSHRVPVSEKHKKLLLIANNWMEFRETKWSIRLFSLEKGTTHTHRHNRDICQREYLVLPFDRGKLWWLVGGLLQFNYYWSCSGRGVNCVVQGGFTLSSSGHTL